ncbi:MAG TPA: sugar transferase [Candidatus Nanoarchaeia archaeon]|nr:sugar transferase [Candidatus Nanoarchaeia archaeon]
MGLVNILEGNIYIRTALGQEGEQFKVYKIRTMEPNADSRYKELVSANGLDELGKPADDDRILPRRRFLRRYGIDELPQIYNIFKREMSLVGIRPKDKEAWSFFPEDHIRRALKHKPGLMGVNYARLNSSLDEMMESESQYLDKKEEHPLLTDIEYFFRILYQIIFCGLRSK